jgi:hypothetical protein
MAALLAACTDLLPPDETTVATADLVVLGLAAEAPQPASASFYVLNGATTVRTLRHADAFSTLYLELRFDPGALASLNGTLLSSADSVLITVTPLSREYGFTLAPAGLVFTEGFTPTAAFSFGRYADPSVADGLFASREGYVAALEVWRETGFDEWAVAAGSGPGGVDEVRASIEAGGRYWLAAALQ